MTYSSQWKIAAYGPDEKLQQLLGFIERHLGESKELDDAGTVFEKIWRAERTFTESRTGLTIGGVSKCYGEWDSVVYEILEFGRSELGLDMAYGRLGEDLGDADFDQGEKIAVGWTWDLCDADFPEP